MNSGRSENGSTTSLFFLSSTRHLPPERSSTLKLPPVAKRNVTKNGTAFVALIKASSEHRYGISAAVDSEYIL